MKCKYCGANIGMRDNTCPYCGNENSTGKRINNGLLSFKQSNEAYKKDVLKQNAVSMTNKIWIYINIALLIIFIVMCTISFIIYKKADEPNTMGHVTTNDINSYYYDGDYESLYYALSESNRFTDDDIDVNIRHVALIWSEYENMRGYYGEMMEYYAQNGSFREQDMAAVIKSAYHVYSHDISYIYKADDLTESDIKGLEDMTREAFIILTYIFDIPEDYTEKVIEEEYNPEAALIEYVKGAGEYE